jgi:hypothetical protein
MRWLWVAGIAMVLAVASACGGGEKAAPSLSDADLKNIVTVSSEGLPTPLTLQSDTATANAQAAGAFADPQKWAANYQKWGRTGGHEASFGVAGGQDAAAQTQAEAYKTIGGAKDALSGLRDFMTSSSAATTYTNMGYTDAKIDVVDAAKVGDDSSSYRLQVSYQGTQFETLVIIFRRGPVLAQASVGSAPDASDFADVEAVANQMDARIQAVLSGQAATPQSN